VLARKIFGFFTVTKRFFHDFLPNITYFSFSSVKTRLHLHKEGRIEDLMSGTGSIELWQYWNKNRQLEINQNKSFFNQKIMSFYKFCWLQGVLQAIISKKNHFILNISSFFITSFKSS